MIIRLATAADSAAAAGVVEAVYAEYGFPWEPEGCQADLYDLGTHYLDRGHLVWVATDGVAVQGLVGLKLFDPVPGPAGSAVEVEEAVRLAGCDAALARLYVHPRARRRGAGTDLLRTALDAARQRGRRAVEIWSDKRLEEAHRLYERFGARPVADRLIFDPDPCEEWGLVVDLGGGA
ncbi:MAG: putative acetyltransferase [Actinomycetota bacterium]|nr:putative acetyltransferase [Actinomycetota bacterium]